MFLDTRVELYGLVGLLGIGRSDEGGETQERWHEASATWVVDLGLWGRLADSPGARCIVPL